MVGDFGGSVGETVRRCPGPTENIIVLGSEENYNSFWWRMMFMAPGVGLAQGSLTVPRWMIAEKTTVLYVPNGYTRHERLPLDRLRDAGIGIVRINALSDLVDYINTRTQDGIEHLILRLVLICHGLPGKFALNYWASPTIDLTTRNLINLSAAAFCPHARVYSYACRTGVWRDKESFASLAEAEPQNSLAQRLANHLGLPVHAFYTRTLFRECLRAPADSDGIAAAVKAGRVGRAGQVINISDEHEALPHPGQGASRFDRALGFGQEAEGTSEYTLWRKQAGRHMPVAAASPTGLPTNMHVFEPA